MTAARAGRRGGLAFYISGHGFGHAVRDCCVMNALRALVPALPIHVRTTAPEWLIRRSVDTAVDYTHVDVDTGMTQLGSLQIDIDDSLRRARAFLGDIEARVAAEAAWLRAADLALVVADIPPLGVAAAAAAGLPSVALGNFTWDWIYGGYEGTADLVDAIGRLTSTADLAVRLPMHGGFETVRHVVDVPFVARRSRREPAETRALLGLPRDRPLALSSFGGFGLAGLDLAGVDGIADYGILLSTPQAGGVAVAASHGGAILPFNEGALARHGLAYEDVVRAVDVVVSKPGYGIIADCVANDTALVYTRRGAFREYDVLVDAMPHVLRVAPISHADLFAGRWRPALDHARHAAPPPVAPDISGADAAARLLLQTLES